MSYFEFQISLPKLLGAQRNALRSAKSILCSPAPIPIGPVQIVLDRIEFGNNAVRHNVPEDFPTFYEYGGEVLPTPHQPSGFKTQIAQEVTVFVSALNDILLRPNQPPFISVPITGTLVFDINFYAIPALGEDCYLQVRFSHFELGPLPFLPPNFDPKTIPLPITIDQIGDVVNQSLAKAIPAPAIPLGLDKLKLGVKFLNAGVSLDTELKFMAFRIQVGGTVDNVDVAWGNFYKGFIWDRLEGRDWSLSVDSGYIETALRVFVEQAIREANIDRLETFPGVHYSNAGGKAVFTIDVLAIYDLPDPLGHLETEPRLSIQLSVSVPNIITIDFDLSQVLDLSDIYAQIAVSLAHMLGIPIESILMGLIGSFAMQGLADSPLQDCQQLSPTHIQCNNRVHLPQVLGAPQATLTSLLTFDEQVSLAGTLNVPDLALPSLQTSLQEFMKATPSITCGPAGVSMVAAFQSDPHGFPIFHAKGFIENTAEGNSFAPLYLCNFRVVNDDHLGAFPLSGIRADSDQASLTITLDMPIPPPGYYDNPYSCDLLVQTSAGTRLMRFAPLPVATEEDLQHIAIELLVKIGNCEQLVDDWARTHHGYNPRWSPRPPEGVAVEHLWQVAVTGLQEGERVSLINEAGQELVRAVARAGTVMRLAAVLPPGGEKELTVFRGEIVGAAQPVEGEGSVNPAQGALEEGLGLEVGQTLLLHLGSIPLPSWAFRLLPAHLEEGLSLLAVMDGGITAYNLEDPYHPLQVRSWSVEGLRGALYWHGKLLTVGMFGIDTVYQHDKPDRQRYDCAASPVLDVAADSRSLYAITQAGLEIYSPPLCRVSVALLEGCRSVLLAGGKLAVGRRDGLWIYDTSDPREPRSLSFLQGLYVAKLDRAPGMEAGSFLALLEDGTVRAFRWNGQALEENARYSQTPWLAGSLRLGDLLVRIGDDHRRIDLYRFGEAQAF